MTATPIAYFHGQPGSPDEVPSATINCLGGLFHYSALHADWQDIGLAAGPGEP